MNKELINYLNKHGTEIISNKHLMFVNELLKKSNVGDFGKLYKLSNHIYRSIKNKDTRTLNEVIDFLNKK